MMIVDPYRFAQKATLDFRGLTQYPSDGQVVTFTGVDIGAPSDSRTVFIEIPWYNLGTNTGTISVTIGGVPATVHSQVVSTAQVNGGQNGGVALVSATLDSSYGSSTTVVVTFSATATTFRPWLAVYRITGLISAAPVDLVSIYEASVSIPRSKSVNATIDGVVFYTNYIYGNSSTRSLSGVTQDYMNSPISSAVLIGGGNTISASGTVTATISGGTLGYMAVIMASFR